MKTNAKQINEQEQESCEKRIYLAAFEDNELSEEAVKQLIALDEDNNRPMHRGKDLPSASKADLLNQLSREVE